jgi:hypothetical protein
MNCEKPWSEDIMISRSCERAIGILAEGIICVYFNSRVLTRFCVALAGFMSCPLASALFTQMARAQAAEPPIAALTEALDQRFPDIEVRSDWCAAFVRFSITELGELMHDPSGIVAVRSAWEAEARRIAVGDEADALRMQRFLGFVEGRVGAAPPVAWERGLLTVTSGGSATRFFPTPPKVNATRSRFRVPDDISFEVVDGFGRIKVADRSTSFPIGVLDELSDSDNPTLAAIVDVDCGVVAAYSDTGDPLVLVCLESKTGTVKWNAYGWGTGMAIATGQGHSHTVELVIANGGVFVFSIGAFAATIERFDLENGKATFRFCTADWCDRRLHIKTAE